MLLGITLVIHVADIFNIIVYIFFDRNEIIRFWNLTFKVKVMKIMSWGIILVMYVVDISDIFHIIGYG